MMNDYIFNEKKYIFNEKKYIEDMINANYVDNNAPMKTIRLLARYCYFVLGYGQDDTYKYIVSYMETYAMEYHEQRSMSKVKACIRDASKKGPWKNIESVAIRKSELDKILTLNDERQEKIAFILLADVKYAAQCSGQPRLASYMSISDIFRLSRVPCPYKERPYFMNFLYKDRDEGSFAERQEESRKKRNPQIRHKLNYVSYDEDDPIVMELTENNYTDLAYTYLNWKNGGYKECIRCGRLFKTKKSGDNIYCPKCQKEKKEKNIKVFTCSGCKEEFPIFNIYNTRTTMCEECYRKHRRKNKTDTMRNLREKNKICGQTDNGA